MSQKYHNASCSATFPLQVITNDIFMAAFFLSMSCTLEQIQTNGRKRVSFVFAGDRVRELREAYRTGPVHLDIRSFRDNLHTVRKLMDEVLTANSPTLPVHIEKRSIPHVRSCTTQPQY